MARIGVFVCWCGENIARTVDVKKVVETAAGFPGVAHAADYRYMCSEPGQKLIADAIREKKLTGLVVAACSPQMHEKTFQKAAATAGLNPYLVEMANIREHCSWVHENRDEATTKAIDIVRMMVAKVRQNEPLATIKVPVTKRALVIGGGIAGIETALSVADSGVDVVLVEKEPSIGGHMAQLGETFPTLDCSQCIMTPKMVEVAQHPRIKLLTYAEVQKLEGFVGNFKATIRLKARYVDADLCTGCGTCFEKCPVKKVTSEFDEGLGLRTAIYRPFPQAVPNKPVIDAANCIMLTKGKCGLCAKVCPTGAVKYDDTERVITEAFGSVIVATGYDVLSTKEFGEYGYGKYADVITSLQFERMESASGPTGGKVVRPSDGQEPKSVVFIQCVGSRDEARHRPYCSKICCMYSAKHAMLYKHKVHDGQAYVFYIDVRAGGKAYEEFVRRAVEEDGAVYLRGRVSHVYREGGKMVVKGVDTLAGEAVEIRADLVVLATALTARRGAAELAQKLGLTYDAYGFYSEAHPKLKPVETSKAGVFIAGACVGPRDIPDSVSSGAAAAAKALKVLSRDVIEREPLVAKVNDSICIHCRNCIVACPYQAIEDYEVRDRKGNLVKVVARVNEGVCQGCGVCAAVCRPRAIDVAGFNDREIYSEIDSLSAW
jgi:heterodisulfide reductase subunit A